MGRIGDYSNKQYLYKVYRKGYSSWKQNYIDIAAGQYIGTTLALTEDENNNKYDNVIFDNFTLYGSGTTIGTITSSAERPIYIKGVVALFNPSWSYQNNLTYVNYLSLNLFDVSIVYKPSDDNTVSLYIKEVLVDTQTITSSFDYIKIYEENDTLYIDYSSDNETWTNWGSYSIDYDNDPTKSQVVFGFDMFGVYEDFGDYASLGDVLIYDKGGQLLAIETENVISPLEFNTEINTPASETTITLNYSPDELPSHITIGNNIEAYANFYDWSSETDYEPILDENGDPILDQNSQPIYGKVLNQGAPENLNNLRFAGYIEDIEYDYDNMTTSVKLVSHGEIMANALIHSEEPEDVSVLSQLLDNASLNTSAAHYQTFRLYKNTKIDRIAMKFGASGGGGGGNYQILSSTGATVLGVTESISWSSGGLGTDVHQLDMTEPLYLEPGVYRLRLNMSGSLIYRYQNTNVYPDGSWSGGAGDLYFNLITSQYSYNVTITGNSDEVIDTAFRYLEENYTLLRKGDVDTSSYDVTVESNIDTVLSLVNNTQKRMDSGWWWHVDPGTNELRFKSQDTTPDHLLVLGRDFTEFKLKKSIADIANIGLFSGGPLVEDGANIAVLAIDNDSIAKYKRGLVIESNEKVTRYDSANLLINNTISNNNKPRYTTTITVEASLYDIETFRIGDLVKISNIGVEPNLSLTIAGIGYSPDKATLSLDTAPTTINVTVEALRRQLENSATANIGDVS